MIVRVTHREDPYVRIDKRTVCDSRLTWKARAILAYLLTKPDCWEVMLADLVKQSPEGPAAVRSGLQELKRLGYAKLETVREAGALAGKRWIVFERPQDEATDPDIAVLRTSTDRTLVTNDRQITNEVDVKAPAPPAELFELKAPPLEFPELPLSLRTAHFQDAWRDWLAQRKALKKPMTALAIKSQVAKLEAMGPELGANSIRISIDRGWTGIFYPSEGAGKDSPPAARGPITEENALRISKR